MRKLLPLLAIAAAAAIATPAFAYQDDRYPTEEHLLPLYVALGAGGDNARVERLHVSATYSVLRMDVYAFEARKAY